MARATATPLSGNHMCKLFAILFAPFLLCSNTAAEAAVSPEPQPVIESLVVGAARFELQFAPGFGAAGRRNARAWISRSAHVVAAYFGGFPVSAATILIIPVDGDRVKSGTTFNDPNLHIRVQVGRDTTPAKYLADWIMVHEMVHLAIPEVPRNQNWFHEGVATYVEIIARAQAGLTDSKGGWAELSRNVGQGMPAENDRGLDHTPTWGRTYWGGALFCMLADVELRKRSNNRVGLQDALRGVVKRGGNYGVSWPLKQTIRTADEATGLTVLSELYDRMKNNPNPPDLAGVWRDLGILNAKGEVTLSDDAPLVAIRRAIIKPNS